MKICNFDLIILFVMIFTVVFIYDQLKNIICTKKEGFQTTTTGYLADVEAIRNLSSIATQLTTNNQLTMPGTLSITNKLATNGLNPNDMPNDSTGGIRTHDVYADGTIACGPNGKQINSSMNSNGDGYFAGNVNITGTTTTSSLYTSGATNNNPGGTKEAPWSTHFPFTDGNNYIRGDTIVDGIAKFNNDIFAFGIPQTRNFITGTLSYTGTDNKDVYKPVIISITSSSPHITINGNTITFKYSNVYVIEANFKIIGYNNCNAGNYNDGNFIFTDTANNLPQKILYKEAISYSDSRETNMRNSDYLYYGKNSNSCGVYGNDNIFKMTIIPTVGKQYNFTSKKLKIGEGTFIIYNIA